MCRSGGSRGRETSVKRTVYGEHDYAFGQLMLDLRTTIGLTQAGLAALLGMGGIGKSMLASYLGQYLAPQFEAVLWRSVRDAPSCEELVADCITFFSETPPAAFSTSLEQRISQLLASGDREGDYLPGY